MHNDCDAKSPNHVESSTFNFVECVNFHSNHTTYSIISFTTLHLSLIK